MKTIGGLGVGMIMGASLMGAYVYLMPKMKKSNKIKKITSPYTASLTNVKDK